MKKLLSHVPTFSLKSVYTKLLCLTGLAFIVAACDTAPTERFITCPEVKVIKGTDQITRFKEGDGRDITDIILNANLIQAQGSCQGFTDSITVNLVVGLQANQGALIGANSQNIDLIIGIVGLDGELIAPAPIGHRKLPITLTFPTNVPVINYEEKIQIEIPREPLQAGSDFRIYVSFGLTPEEYNYNNNN